MRTRTKTRQRGVAIITALLLTTLAISIVASLFWQQQVQVRSMENQRLHLQTKWILRGALDWATLVLRQDGYDHPNYTALDAVWATPLAETRLDQYIERERVDGETFNATLAGNITDATSRYNLTNLAQNGQIVPDQQRVFEKLLRNLHLDPNLAKRTALAVAASQPPVPTAEQGAGGQGNHGDPGNLGDQGNQGNQGNTGGQGSQDNTGGQGNQGSQGGTAANQPGQGGRAVGPVKTMKLLKVEDLLSVEGFNQQMIEKLRPFVIVLPVATPVNVNTAPAEVLAAVLPNASISEANVLLVRRKQAPWNDISKFRVEVNEPNLDASIADVKSEWFLVDSRIRLDRAALDAVSLVNRPLGGLNVTVTGTGVQWTREY